MLLDSGGKGLAKVRTTITLAILAWMGQVRSLSTSTWKVNYVDGLVVW